MKYLLFSLQQPARDIDHALDRLRDAVREAIHLNRTLVIGTFSLAASGNLDQHREKIKYDRFININKTQICKIESGNITQIEESFNYVNEEDFDLKTYPNDEVLIIENGKPVGIEQNNQYKLIIRKAITDKNAYNYRNILVRFSASGEVDRLTDIVLKAMGSGLEQVKKRFAIYRHDIVSANQDFFQKVLPSHPAYYACVYIPSGEHLTPDEMYATDISQIRKAINRLHIRGMATYIMSDIDDFAYFNSLKKRYRKLYRYSDFRELKALISGDNGQLIDNAMLYSVEKNILQYAAVKIIPFKDLSGLPIIYTNASYKIPRRYRLSAWYKSLMRVITRRV